jgi:hypothetical protein
MNKKASRKDAKAQSSCSRAYRIFPNLYFNYESRKGMKGGARLGNEAQSFAPPRLCVKKFTVIFKER